MYSIEIKTSLVQHTCIWYVDTFSNDLYNDMLITMYMYQVLIWIMKEGSLQIHCLHFEVRLDFGLTAKVLNIL